MLRNVITQENHSTRMNPDMTHWWRCSWCGEHKDNRIISQPESLDEWRIWGFIQTFNRLPFGQVTKKHATSRVKEVGERPQHQSHQRYVASNRKQHSQQKQEQTEERNSLFAHVDLLHESAPLSPENCHLSVSTEDAWRANMSTPRKK